MNDGQDSHAGYESGAFKENSSAGTSGHSAGNSSERGNNYGGSSGWAGGNRQNAGAKPGGFRRFNKFAGGNANEVPRDFNLDPPILYRPYVGTGNADAPEGALNQLKETMQFLEKHGYTVRTSAFDGPDKVFSQASWKQRELILPWRGFAGAESKLTFTSEEAKYFAKKYFGKDEVYDKLPDTVKTFMAKNVRLVCGQNLKSPAQFLVLWTEDGCENPKERTPKTGYSSHLITVAHELKIPIFNFGKSDAKERLLRYLKLDQT